MRDERVDPDEVPEDTPVIDLTNPYDADWMARGRKENTYRGALAEYLTEVEGYDTDTAEMVKNRGFSSGLSIMEEEWDEIWAMEADPADAMYRYLGEETIEALMAEDFETYHRNRTRQKAQHRPHIREVHPKYFEEG